MLNFRTLESIKCYYFNQYALELRRKTVGYNVGTYSLVTILPPRPKLLCRECQEFSPDMTIIILQPTMKEESTKAHFMENYA